MMLAPVLPEHFDKTVSALHAHLHRTTGLSGAAPRSVLASRAVLLLDVVASYAATVTAVSGYTMVAQSMTPPTLVVQAEPSGPGVSQDVYDQYANDFMPVWNMFKTQMSRWMLPGQPNTGLYQSLATVPNTIIDANYNIATDLLNLTLNDPTSPAYASALASLEQQINGLLAELQPLVSALEQYTIDIESGTQDVIEQANTGALYGALQGYQVEIDTLNSLVDQAQNAVSDSCTDLLDDVLELGGFFAMGAVGLVGFFTPEPTTSVLGAITTVAAGIGFVGTVADMVSVGVSIAGDKSEISVYRNSIDIDGQSLVDLGVMINQINGFSAMNARAIAALTQVADAYRDLLVDIGLVLADAQQDDPEEATQEWNAINAAAEGLGANAAYYWPNCYDCYECKTVAPTSNGMMALGADGQLYSYMLGTNSWHDEGVQGVSVIATGDLVLRINARPLSALGTGGTVNTYYASVRRNGSWVDISTFAVANITAFGSEIYAVRSGYTGGSTQVLPGDALTEVLKYSGSGTAWSSLGSPDREDVPAFIEAYEHGILVTTLRYGRCYFWDGRSWTRIGTDADIVLSPVAVNNGFSMIDAQYCSYISSPADPRLLYTDSGIYSTSINGAFVQYVVSSSGELSSIVQQDGENYVTHITGGVTGIFGDPTGRYFYFMSRQGELFHLSGTGAGATWTSVAALPT